MIQSVAKGVEDRHTDLHNMERPVALLSSIYVNSQRDPKKNKAASWMDFCFYKPRNDGNSANVENGSAMMALAKKGFLPAWTLFCFKEVTAHYDSDYEPQVLAFIAEDAILIHPVRTETGYTGLLIAQESAGMRMRDMINPETGETIRLRIPSIHTKIVAEEGAKLGFN